MIECLREEVEKILAAENKVSGFYDLVDTYYQIYIWEIDKDLPDSVYPLPQQQELQLGVFQRPSGIGEALDQLHTAGLDVNGSYGGFNALMLTVGAGDYHLTEYLLSIGANPTTWPDMHENPVIPEQNYYLDDIDIHYFDESAANDGDLEYQAMLVKTAEVLVQKGGLRDYGGMCLLVEKDGTISFDRPKMRY